MRVGFGFREVAPDEKASLVRGVFDSVARRYDLMSLGAHRLWKDATAARLNPQPGETIIDCAGGTGDLARRFASLAGRARRRRGGAPARIVVIDCNAEMIAQGRARGAAEEIAWALGDAERLPLADASVEAYAIGFGLRNVTDVPKALAEARRVLRPGGRFVCLEFSRLRPQALRPLYDAFSFRVIPRIGRAVANDADAYAYLVESIRRFPDQATLAAMIARAGFARVSVTNFAGGVAALHQAWAL